MNRVRWWQVGLLAALIVIGALVLLSAPPDVDPIAQPSSTTEGSSGQTSGGAVTTASESIAPATTHRGEATSTSLAATSTTAAPTTTLNTLKPAEDGDVGQVIDDPVPYRTSVALDRWQIGVSDADLNATDFVLEFVDFNEPPAEGNRYVIVEISGIQGGPGATEPVFDWRLAAPGFEHRPDGLECGVIPRSIYDIGPVGPGGAFTASVCFEIPEEFADAVLLLSLSLFDESRWERFFSLG